MCFYFVLIIHSHDDHLLFHYTSLHCLSACLAYTHIRVHIHNYAKIIFIDPIAVLFCTPPPSGPRTPSWKHSCKQMSWIVILIKPSNVGHIRSYPGYIHRRKKWRQPMERHAKCGFPAYGGGEHVFLAIPTGAFSGGVGGLQVKIGAVGENEKSPTAEAAWKTSGSLPNSVIYRSSLK